MNRRHLTRIAPLAAFVGAAWLAVACSNAPTSEPPGVRTAGTIAGTQLDLHHTDSSGIVAKPVDLSGTTIRAFTSAPDGGMTIAIGSGTADGTYTIANVPAGPYLLQVGKTYVATTADKVELGGDQLGRPEAQVQNADQSTALVLDLDGLTAWNESNDLQVFSSNAGAWGSLLRGMELPPDYGATELRERRVSWFDAIFESVVMDPSLGDRAYLFQLASNISPTGEQYISIRKSTGPEPVAITNGSASKMQRAHLADVSQNVAADLAWQRSKFAELATGIRPGAAALMGYLYVDAQPGGAARGWFADTPDLLLAGQDGGESDLRLGRVSFANPFPSDWALFIDARAYAAASYAIDGARPTSAWGQISVQQLLSAVDGQPIEPLVGPVSGITIDRADAQADVTLSSATPTLRWRAPAFGLAHGYTLFVRKLTVAGDAGHTRTRAELAAELHTEATEIRLPPGLLEDGGRYFVVVRSRYLPGVDLSRTPSRNAFPAGAADAFTGVLTVHVGSAKLSAKRLASRTSTTVERSANARAAKSTKARTLKRKTPKRRSASR